MPFSLYASMDKGLPYVYYTAGACAGICLGLQNAFVKLMNSREHVIVAKPDAAPTTSTKMGTMISCSADLDVNVSMERTPDKIATVPAVKAEDTTSTTPKASTSDYAAALATPEHSSKPGPWEPQTPELHDAKNRHQAVQHDDIAALVEQAWHGAPAGF